MQAKHAVPKPERTSRYFKIIRQLRKAGQR